MISDGFEWKVIAGNNLSKALNWKPKEGTEEYEEVNKDTAIIYLKHPEGTATEDKGYEKPDDRLSSS